MDKAIFYKWTKRGQFLCRVLAELGSLKSRLQGPFYKKGSRLPLTFKVYFTPRTRING